MTPLEFLVPIEALEALTGVLPYVLLVLVLANLVTRHLAHRKHKRAYRDDAELSHYTPHVAVSILLVLASFLFMVFHPHAGMVLSVLIVGMVVSDFFEFEARQVEARNGLPIEAPKSAIAASFVVLLYTLYQSLFWVIKGPWEQII
jgi:hypothetical protein